MWSCGPARRYLRCADLLAARATAPIALRLGHEVVPEHEHVADRDSVLPLLASVIPEVVAPHRARPEAALLIEGDLAEARAARAHLDRPSLAASSLRHEPLHDAAADAMPLVCDADRELHELARIVAPAHRRRTDERRA